MKNKGKRSAPAIKEVKLEELGFGNVNFQSVDQQVTEILGNLLTGNLPIKITGKQGTGKTSFMKAFSEQIRGPIKVIE